MENSRTIWSTKMKQEEKGKRYARLVNRASLVFTPEGVIGLMENPKFLGRIAILHRDTLEQCLSPKGRWFVEDGEFIHEHPNGWTIIYRKMDVSLEDISKWISLACEIEHDSVSNEMKEYALRKIADNTSALGGEIMASERAMACAQRGV